jgi:Domain of unknown function (DUF4417)
MPIFNVPGKTISLFGSTCRVGNGDFLPDIPIEEVYHVTNSCENPFNRSIITCQSQDLNKFVDEVNGLQLDLPIKSADIDLPLYFPTLDIKSAAIMQSFNPDQYIGTSLRHFTSSLVNNNAGSYRPAKEIRFQPVEKFSCFKDHPRMILFLTGTDTGIEYAWKERERYELIKNIKERHVLAVGAFNFSLFNGDCSVAQILNQKRSLFAAHYLHENDISVIPHLYSITPFQLDRWINWLLQNPGVKLITINCQFSKPELQRTDDINIIKKILIAVPYLHIIVEGFPFDSIFRFGPYIDNLHFTDKVPMQQAKYHNEIVVDNIHRKLIVPSTESLPELIAKNTERRLLQVHLIRKYIFEFGIKSTG